MKKNDKTIVDICEKFRKLGENEQYHIWGIVEGMALSNSLPKKTDDILKDETIEKEEEKKE